MKNNLKKIYESKDGFNILASPSYYFTTNPIYQVNNFIMGLDPSLNKNFISNLKDLKIVNEKNGLCKSDYNYITNTIYSHDNISDVFGLLHMASNDRSKKYTGIITENEVGYGLNNGLTEVFTNKINNKKFAYPVEATVANALLMINSDIIINSYFNNDGESLVKMNANMKRLMSYLDSYHDNYIELMISYNERFVRNYFKIKSNNQKQKVKLLEEKIHRLEYDNYTNIYHVFDALNNIIYTSMIKEEEKQEIYVSLYNEFNTMFMNEEFRYLKDLSLEFEKNIYVKEKVKCKK